MNAMTDVASAATGNSADAEKATSPIGDSVSALVDAIGRLPNIGGGLMVSFEGIDGAGKSSHIGGLSNAFAQAGREVILTREPGGTPLAERLREMVLNEPMDPMTEALLVFAGRRDHLQQVILPGLQRGALVICDRFTDSTFAYQGGGRGFDRDVLLNLEVWVQEGRQPDLTLWFDLPPEVAARRRGAVREPDRFESQDLRFFENVRAAYAERMAQHPERFIQVNALQPQEAVWYEVCDKLAERLKPFLQHRRTQP